MGYLRIKRYGRNAEQRSTSPNGRANSTIQTGTVKWFDAARGFGFIVPNDGSNDVFVHVSAVQQSGINTLEEGQTIEYELFIDQSGKSAAKHLREC